MGIKTKTSFTEGNKANLKHGAEGTLKRIAKGLPLAEDDKRLHSEIVSQLGYDPDNLPSGALGLAVDLLADNLLLAIRFKGARHWAAQEGDLESYVSLAQKSGWRNDKALAQLLEFMKLQKADNALDYEQIIASGGKE